jgi:hypothetical protein
MHRNIVPDVFEIPRQKFANTIPWLTALSIAAIVVGGTLALVLAGGLD